MPCKLLIVLLLCPLQTLVVWADETPHQNVNAGQVSQLLKTFAQDNHPKSNNTTALSNFEQFPFVAYLAEVRLNDYQQLEEDRQFLLSQNINGNKFITQLAKEYLQQNPIDWNNLEAIHQRIALGRLYEQQLPQILPDYAMAYEMLGMYLLTNTYKTLQTAIATQQVNAEHRAIYYLLEQLNGCGYYLDQPKSKWSKFVEAVLRFDVHYLYIRAMRYQKYLLYGMVGLLFLGLLLRKPLQQKHNYRRLALALVLLTAIGVTYLWSYHEYVVTKEIANYQIETLDSPNTETNKIEIASMVGD